MNSMTAAHRTLPLGTWVRVTNEENNESVVVQVTDRGPYVADRILDLSRAAATKLGYMGDGTTQVKMDVLGEPESTGSLFASVVSTSENLTSPVESSNTPSLASVFDIVGTFTQILTDPGNAVANIAAALT